MKEFFAFLSIGLAFVAYIPYLRDTFAGKTRPHIFSWFTWSLVSFIAFGLQVSNDGGAGSLTNFVMGIICLVIALRALQNGVKEITKADIASLVLTIISVYLWIVINQPMLSMVALLAIDFFSFIPTVIKTWKSPNSETVLTWGLSIVRHFFTISAMQQRNTITVLHPLYSLITNGLFVAMIVLRKKYVRK